MNNGGTLQLQANAANTTAGVSSALAPEETANQPLVVSSGGTVQLRSDSSVTFSGGNNFGGLGNATITIDVNQITAGNTNNTLTLAPGGFATLNTTLNVTGGNGYSLALGPVTAGNSGTLAFNTTTANASIGALPATVTTLTKSGAGTLTLTSTDAHAGVTTVSAGVLQVGTGATTGTLAAGAVTNNGTLAFNHSDTVTVPNVISGTGALSQVGSGTVVVTGANTYTGATSVSTGTLQVGAGGTAGNINNAGAVNLSNNGSLVFNRSDTVPFTGVIGGAGSLTQAGPGTLILAAANTYTGNTSVTNGTLRLAGPGANAPALANASFESPALAANTFTYAGAFSTTQLSSFAWTPSGNGLSSTAGGPALINTSTAWGYTTPYPNGTQEVSMQKDSAITQSLTFTNPGYYTVTWSAEERNGQTNPGVLKLDGAVVSNFTAPSSTAYTSYSATLFVPAGTHTLGFAGTVTAADQSYALDNIGLTAATTTLSALPATTVLNVSGQSTSGGPSGTFDLGGSSQPVAGLTGGGISGTGTVYGSITNSGVADSTLTVTGAGNFAGIVSDGPTNKVGLTKSTAGTLVLSGANTYTGPTQVSGGTLSVTGSLGNSAVTVATGATLGGSGSIGGPATVGSGGNLAPSLGLTTLIGHAFTAAGGLAFTDATSKFTVDLASPSAPGTGYDQVLYTGSAALAGATLIVNDAAYAAGAHAVGDKFWILDGTASNSSAVTPAFASASTVTGTSGFTYSVQYNQSGDPAGSVHDVLLTTTAVPEPASLGLLGLGAAGLLARRRRARG